MRHSTCLPIAPRPPLATFGNQKHFGRYVTCGFLSLVLVTYGYNSKVLQTSRARPPPALCNFISSKRRL